jgi:transcriptional regulator with XRE-family HTH domain
MTEFHWEFGERVRQIRKEIAGLNQEELGAELGVSRQTINAYERDRQKPTVTMIEAMCAKYNVSPVWLLTGAGNMQERRYMKSDPEESESTPEQEALVKFINEDAKRAAKLAKVLMDGGLNNLL